MKTWADIYDLYLRDIPECTYITAADALRDAAQVFCERTRAWRMTLNPVLTVAGVAEYAIPLPLDIELVRVFSAKIGGRDTPLVREACQGERGIVIHGLRTYTVYPTPEAAQGVVLNVAIEPSNAATGLDDVIFAKYARIIAKSAKARLLAMENQPFSNPARAVALYAEFDMDVDRVISDVNAQYSAAPQRVKAHFC